MTDTADRVPAAPNEPTNDDQPMFPPGRYGRRREAGSSRSRWTIPLIALAIVAVTGLVSVKLYKQYGSPQYSPTVVKLTNATDSSITVTFRVDKPNGSRATCTVDALARTGAALGTAQVPVPTGKSVEVTATIPTTARAYIVQVPSCRSAD